MAGDLKLLRTICFDHSDRRVFEHAAPPGEWAIPGGFAFSQMARQDMQGKTGQAFANGFLGLDSLGRSTFASVASVERCDVSVIEETLAMHFIDVYGAPDLEAALPEAKREIEFVASLCRDVPLNTIFTLRRQFDEQGQIREEFRTIAAPTDTPMHTKIWKGVDSEP